MKRPSSATRQLVLGGVAVCAVVVVALFMRGSPAAPAAKPDQQAAPSSVEAGSTPLAGGPPAGAQPSAPEPPPMPEEAIASVLKKDKKLALFMDYKKTVLLDATRRDEYRKLLSSVDMMTAMADELMKPGSGHVEPEEYYRRLMQIDYFEAALTWKDNPQRDKVLALTGDIIAKDNFVGGLDGARRQMLGGNKMELYRLMYEHDAPKADALVAQAQGTRMQPLVDWLAGEELRRRTREQEIQKEIEELQAKAH